jgi:hypothetical protein
MMVRLRVPYASVMVATAQIHLGDLPTWLAALGTVGALAAALWQISTERKRRHEREEQAREERHLAQARLIAAVMGPEEESGGLAVPERTGIDLINGSPEPVYRLVVAIVSIQGLGGTPTIEKWLEYRDRQHALLKNQRPRVPITTASILPSGTYRIWIDGTGWDLAVSGMGRAGAEVAFTDRAGSHWIRHASGQLEELAEDPISHYLGAGPHDLVIPERLT